MKKIIPYVITGVLVIAILFLNNPLKNMNAFSYKDSLYYQKYASMDETEVYEELMTHDIDYILHETEMLGNDIGTSDLDIYIFLLHRLCLTKNLKLMQEICLIFLNLIKQKRL